MTRLEKGIDKESKVRTFIMADEREIKVDLQDIEMIFKGYRPRLISREDFRFINKIIKKEVRDYVKGGTMVHLSKVSDSLWKEYYDKGLVKTHIQRGHTYIKAKKDEER